MNPFAATEQRIDVTRRKHPAFPRAPAVVVRLIKRLHKHVQDDANALLKPFGINHPEYNLLMMLYGSADNAVTPSELAEAAGEKFANITRLTDRLCDKGLLARSGNAEDRRKVTLSLTARGDALIGRMLPGISRLLDRETAALSARELEHLERLLKKMLSGFSSYAG
ncbi:MarR family winged helix-turn-helix transcriptional regulator [Luteimonas aquatica]|uniref:MarR family winged helix-turn-helix transcriptional regulator n=1 Tax=Luteimonas aquatica TaxID=450364 RepID=UPI001F57A0F4|nr:MarR family transcriptional regulator [Luteimonas aquatica]